LKEVKVISVESTFFERFPRLAQGRARVLAQPVVQALRAVACEDLINRELARLQPAFGFDFIARALETFAIDCSVDSADRHNIPSEGRVLIVANHPLGVFDALALLHVVGSVRRDVRILANNILSALAPIADLLLPVEVFGAPSASHKGLREALRMLGNEQALIVFPAGEVSRIAGSGIRDRRWADGFVRIARRMQAPIVPVHIAARNSAVFYGVSMLAKPLSSLLLPREMLGAANSKLSMSIGETIAHESLQADSASTAADKIRRHVYRVGQRRAGIYSTQPCVAHAESSSAVRQELQDSPTLGVFADGKRAILVDGRDGPVLRELGRLRELSFRSVGEGSGKRRDIDRFDYDYRHLVLWDDAAQAIAGAYRIGDAGEILRRRGVEGLYSASLFKYTPAAAEFLDQGVELGRSFVQPAYWRSRALDLLWQGLGAHLQSLPRARYLFGPVSMSARLDRKAREWIAHFHQHYFGDRDQLAHAKREFQISAATRVEASALWRDHDARSASLLLKHRIAEWGAQIPILFRRYVELCEPHGLRFLAFGEDPGFANCVDGLIRLDISAMRATKRDRYLCAKQIQPV
jgi:putative hemolysin